MSGIHNRPKGLYYCDYSRTKGVLLANDGVEPAGGANAVEKNMENFNRKKIKDAIVTR